MNVGNVAKPVDIERPVGQVRKGHLTGKGDWYAAGRWQRRIEVVLGVLNNELRLIYSSLMKNSRDIHLIGVALTSSVRWSSACASDRAF